MPLLFLMKLFTDCGLCLFQQALGQISLEQFHVLCHVGRLLGTYNNGADTVILVQKVEAESGEPLGYLVAYSTMESFGGMTQPLINTVLLTSLWIILGALVVLYLFCERIAGPLREMSHVTKSFSKGKK